MNVDLYDLKKIRKWIIIKKKTINGKKDPKKLPKETKFMSNAMIDDVDSVFP